MNTIALLLSWQVGISIAGICIVATALFLSYFYLVLVPKWNEKVLASDALLRENGRPVDFPEPLYVEVFRPDPVGDSNRMIWHISKDCVWDGMPMKLQKFLEAKLNHKSDLSIKVYEVPKGGVWVNLRKLKTEKKEWEEIIISAEEHLKVFFDRRIEFYRKKDEVVASS